MYIFTLLRNLLHVRLKAQLIERNSIHLEGNQTKMESVALIDAVVSQSSDPEAIACFGAIALFAFLQSLSLSLIHI